MLPDAPGTYALILRLPRAASVSCGRLGCHRLAAGWYAYVGSALGPGGLAARIAHHVRPVAKPHWHIDRLRRAAQVVAVWYTVGDTHLECLWAAALAGQAGAGRPIRGFGASDCRCPGHLIALPGPLDGRVLAAALGPSGELVTLEPDTKAPDVPSGASGGLSI